MTEITTSLLTLDARTQKRNAAERRFRAYGLAAVLTGLLLLVILLVSVLSNGLGAFRQTFVTVDITLDRAQIEEAEAALVKTKIYRGFIEDNIAASLEAAGVTEANDASAAADLLSKDAAASLRDWARTRLESDGEKWSKSFDFLAAGRIDGYLKGRVTMESAALDSKVTPEQLQLADTLRDAGVLVVKFNTGFFTLPDASENQVEAAGLGVAILGSAYLMLIVLFLALPIGVAASIYLEEFAPKNRLTDLIEVNISNLAAVPSIVFGILGLAIFINFIGLPQSAPIVGGLVLTLMTLPTIIISTRAALKAVPPSIRDGALGVGASPMQTVFHHVLPLAAPGILTGTIIGLAQALGETAPLLLIGMVAFVREYPAGPPEGFFDPASALPVQVYNWTQRADPAFFERASGAIIVLLIFLAIMNITAVFLRRKFERRW
ncbi:phosphate ABC transporter permease PstA [Palleronia caenipelagi]|uniref:Phosphate transport system permease protein PstA n=1 Tax=Palleronia caenipelagi TaxID=2489174 RepID=A0A547Q632_9RHOB|nr:phosphate ABC transporter permease PstA [Palleronia caenipelagi]TRD21820.1 phosphate ABC transporter permease PstA [Palleronia caenipelagi]